MREESTDKLREACGTLPNREEIIVSNIYFGCEILEVELIDKPCNPYKSIFEMATATWGDDQYRNKWKRVGALQRYIVVSNALKGNTLPTALESPQFTFTVRGVPRHCFDQMARARIGTGFGSIGCRDNSKLDSSFILYSEYKKMSEDINFALRTYMKLCKDIYKDIISKGKESYQMARSVLPMSYHHPFVFTQNLLALLGQCRRRMCFGEEEFIVGIHWEIRNIFQKKLKWNLIANAMRPACDFAHKCLYSKGDGTELFGNLFAGCGRWPSKSDYSEFNKTCTNKENLELDMGIRIPTPDKYVNFTPDEEGFSRLGEGDKMLFNEE
jgi:thymidylate synthase ThyX